MPKISLAPWALILIGCGAGGDGAAEPSPPGRTAAPAEADLDPEPPRTRVLIVGDSLAAGYGLAEAQAFPALLETALRERGWSVDVVNAGVSGDTTAGGLARLPWLLRQRPDVVVVELGGNDVLRGLPIDAAAENLAEIVRLSRAAGAEVLLTGMKVPPNYGADYASGFEAIYPRLAQELGVDLMPFLLEGVGGRAELNLGDGIHPNAEGHRIIADLLLPYVESVLERIGATGAGREAA